MWFNKTFKKWFFGLTLTTSLGVLTTSCFNTKVQTQEQTNNSKKENDDFEQIRKLPKYIARVVDGDTIKIQKNNQEISVRLFGIDTPETYKPDKQEKLASKENEYAKEATLYLKSLVSDKVVFLKEFGVDRYNRILAIVYNSKGDNLNNKLVKSGLARVYYISKNKSSPYYTDTNEKENIYNELKLLESEAKISRVGFWKESRITDVFHKFFSNAT